MPSNAALRCLIYAAIGVVSVIVLWLLIRGLVKLIKILRVVTEEPFTFDAELRKQMLPFGVYIICGRQRAGKGSLSCAIMDTDATYHADERQALAQEKVDKINEQDDYGLELPEHLYYSKNKMYLTENYLETYHADVLDVALPETENDAHFPPYAMVCLEEMDAVLNARTWKDGARQKANVIDAYKWGGHHHMTIIGDVQVFGRLDAAVRALATDVFYILRRKDYYSDDEPRKWWQFARREENHVIRTVWDFLWISNQLHQESQALSQFGDFIKQESYIKKCRCIYNGNIYDRYNSYSGEPYWYKNIKSFSCAPHPDDSLSREAVDDYCKRNARRAENATSETEK
ncbi:MAG: hypothetical protein NC037_01070 [Bacteroides sp.]|nr:hypothetical protein [Bacillota bacterium]MCM1393514.1 hypothetical protein [[Eubacterium] siraeum]MCM1455107.1 hypothetical protein [Bacteroides sp.]